MHGAGAVVGHRPDHARRRTASRETRRCALSQRGEQLVELLVALDDAGLHAAGHERVAVLEASRPTTPRSTRQRPSPRSSNVAVSSATLSGKPSKVKVCTIRSSGGPRGRTRRTGPRSPSSPRAVAPGAAGAAVELLRCSKVRLRGPIHCRNRSRLGVGPEHVRHGGVELAGDGHRRDASGRPRCWSRCGWCWLRSSAFMCVSCLGRRWLGGSCPAGASGRGRRRGG